VRLGAALAGVMLAGSAQAQETITGPYLLDASPTGFTVVWDTEERGTPVLQYTVDELLFADVTSEERGNRWRHVGRIDGLSPGDEVEYRAAGPIHRATTFPDDRVRLAFVSDLQLDTANPTAWEQVAADILAEHQREPLHALVVAGDAVDEPGDTSQWDSVLRMAREVLWEVPLFVVPGNDDGGAAELGLETPWRVDAGPVRLLGLDTRVDSRLNGQISWLDDQLDCDPLFTVGVMHHPFIAELFTPDNNDYSGQIVERLGAQATDCDTSSAHVFGAAHGYSRGDSLDHRHAWIGAGSGGGPLDEWGTEPQAPSEEIAISRPEYGFVVLEAAAAGMVWSRHTLGEGVTDTLELASDGAPPARPSVTVDGDVATGSAFDGVGPISAAHWRIEECNGGIVEERWIRRFDEYDGEVIVFDPTAIDIEQPCFFAQVRYRDATLRWSEFSPLAPETADDPTASNLCDCSTAGAQSGPWLLALLCLRRRRSRSPKSRPHRA
jgi:acid phosphatase type 7